jgi:hypothetical protein
MPGDTGMPVKPGCPSGTPTLKDSCIPLMLECEYGPSPSPKCNQIYTCTSNGWVESVKNPMDCVVGTCPSTYEDATSEMICDTQGLQCLYKTDGVCGCGNLFGGSVFDWDCVPGSTACPSPRPRLGTPCKEDLETCGYAECAGGVQIECTGGYWVSSPAECVD